MRSRYHDISPLADAKTVWLCRNCALAQSVRFAKVPEASEKQQTENAANDEQAAGKFAQVQTLAEKKPRGSECENQFDLPQRANIGDGLKRHGREPAGGAENAGQPDQRR